MLHYLTNALSVWIINSMSWSLPHEWKVSFLFVSEAWDYWVHINILYFKLKIIALLVHHEANLDIISVPLNNAKYCIFNWIFEPIECCFVSAAFILSVRLHGNKTHMGTACLANVIIIHSQQNKIYKAKKQTKNKSNMSFHVVSHYINGYKRKK